MNKVNMRKTDICNCGNKKDIRAKKCKSCYLKWISISENNPLYNKKPEENPNYKDGRSLKEYYCIECENKIHKNTFLYSTKQCFSCAMKARKGKSNPNASKKGVLNNRYGKLPAHGKKYWYKDICFRSSWEGKYAEYLDLNNITWLYEKIIFKIIMNSGIDGTYTPDFYLPDTDEYIEIKGYWRGNTKEKFDCFKKQYNDKKITLLQKEELKNLQLI